MRSARTCALRWCSLTLERSCFCTNSSAETHACWAEADRRLKRLPAVSQERAESIGTGPNCDRKQVTWGRRTGGWRTPKKVNAEVKKSSWREAPGKDRSRFCAAGRTTITSESKSKYWYWNVFCDFSAELGRNVQKQTHLSEQRWGGLHGAEWEKNFQIMKSLFENLHHETKTEFGFVVLKTYRGVEVLTTSCHTWKPSKMVVEVHLLLLHYISEGTAFIWQL